MNYLSLSILKNKPMKKLETLIQQLSDMVEAGEIGNADIKDISYRLEMARRRKISADRKADPNYASKKAAAAAKAANTRAQNKKDDEADLKAYKAGLDAEEREIQKRRSDNKLPLIINADWIGVKKTKKALGDLSKYYSEKFIPAGPGGQSSVRLELKPKFKDQTFDNAQTAWDVYDGKGQLSLNEQFSRMQILAGL